MVSANAALRSSQKETNINQTTLPATLTGDIANTWVTMTAIEEGLAEFSHQGSGIVSWRVAPQAQGVMAALLSANVQTNDKIICAGGVPAYPWQVAAGIGVLDIFKIHMGKIFPNNVLVSSIEDAVTMADAPINIIALHVEDEQGLEDIRHISASVVNAETPTLIVVSADIDVPETSSVEMLNIADVDGVKESVMRLHAAIQAVREQGAIRVVVCPDITTAQAENVMMNVAGVAPENWTISVSGAQDSVNQVSYTACQAGVETF